MFVLRSMSSMLLLDDKVKRFVLSEHLSVIQQEMSNPK